LGDVARHLLLVGNELGGEGGELANALPHYGKTLRHGFDLLEIRRVCGGYNGASLRCQPGKLRGRACNHIPGCIAVGLPSQGGNNTYAKRDQEAGEGARGSLAKGWPLVWVLVRVSRANRRIHRLRGG
jgi:hypothetical protein